MYTPIFSKSKDGVNKKHIYIEQSDNVGIKILPYIKPRVSTRGVGVY